MPPLLFLPTRHFFLSSFLNFAHHVAKARFQGPTQGQRVWPAKGEFAV